jgi:polyphosphate kinase 2
MFEYDIAEYSLINPDLYRRELRKLQAEFLKLQKWVINEKKRLAIVFEGRDTAGKTGSISVLSKYLIPEHVRLVKLGIPSEYESRRWFSRYEKHMPNTGEIVFFDRSWYTRALTEITMKYCTERQYKYFMKNVLNWEERLIKDKIDIVKIYLSVKKDTQKKRFEKRKNSPLIFWKFSENDLKVADKWDAFTFYKNQMFSTTSSIQSPWVIINANTKMIASLNSLRYILEKFDYPEKKIPKPKKWSRGMNIYNVTINGVKFENLSYDQYKVLNSFSDG